MRLHERVPKECCKYVVALGEHNHVLMGTYSFVRSDKEKNIAFQKVLLRNLNANVTQLPNERHDIAKYHWTPEANSYFRSKNQGKK